MDALPTQTDEMDPDEPLGADEKKGGIVGPIFLTIFTFAITIGLILMPFFAGREPLQGLLEAPKWWAENIGEYHPLILHLPIGIIFLTMVKEVLGWLSFGRYRPLTGLGLFLAFVTGAFACVTGFFDLKISGRKADGWDDQWYQHMWLGIIFVGILGLAMLAKVWGRRNGSRGPIYGILLLGAAGVMGYGAHLGGVKVHKNDPVINTLEGVGWLEPEAKKTKEKGTALIAPGLGAAAGGAAADGVVAPADAAAIKAPKDRLAFADVVYPIMDQKCLYCHSEEAGKSKGGLYMDTYENLLLGGSSQDGDEYRTLVPGDSKKSYMIEVMSLSMDDDMHMPPSKKEQMEAHEIELLTWWVDHIPEGETLEDQTLEEMGAPQNILDAAMKMVSPEEIKEMEEKKAALEEKAEVERVAKREELSSSMLALKEDEVFKTALSYVTRESSDLEFSAVSFREKFGDEDFVKLEKVAGALTTLNLSASSVTEAVLIAQLDQMPNLVKLNLSQMEVGDAAMEKVASLEKLEYLNLFGTQVSDEGIIQLGTLVNLKRLYLWGSQATQEGADRLKEELPGVEVFFGIS